MNGQWRNLEQLADDPSFVARAAQEFPGLAEALASPHRSPPRAQADGGRYGDGRA